MSLPPKHMSRIGWMDIIENWKCEHFKWKKSWRCSWPSMIRKAIANPRIDSFESEEIFLFLSNVKFAFFWHAKWIADGEFFQKLAQCNAIRALRDSWMAFAHQSLQWVNQCHTRTQWRLVASDNTCNTNRKEEKYYSVYISGGVKKSTKIISQKSLSSHSIRETVTKLTVSVD